MPGFSFADYGMPSAGSYAIISPPHLHSGTYVQILSNTGFNTVVSDFNGNKAYIDKGFLHIISKEDYLAAEAEYKAEEAKPKGFAALAAEIKRRREAAEEIRRREAAEEMRRREAAEEMRRREAAEEIRRREEATRADEIRRRERRIGQRVQIQGLQNRVHLNGQIGNISHYFPDRERYHVILDSGVEITPKEINLIPAPFSSPEPEPEPARKFNDDERVKIKGITSKPELNGKIGIIQKYYSANRRYEVRRGHTILGKIAEDKLESYIPSSSKFHIDQRVLLSGLIPPSPAQLNGEVGIILDYDNNSKKYQVSVKQNSELILEFEVEEHQLRTLPKPTSAYTNKYLDGKRLQIHGLPPDGSIPVSNAVNEEILAQDKADWQYNYSHNFKSYLNGEYGTIIDNGWNESKRTYMLRIDGSEGDVSKDQEDRFFGHPHVEIHEDNLQEPASTQKSYQSWDLAEAPGPYVIAPKHNVSKTGDTLGPIEGPEAGPEDTNCRAWYFASRHTPPFKNIDCNNKKILRELSPNSGPKNGRLSNQLTCPVTSRALTSLYTSKSRPFCRAQVGGYRFNLYNPYYIVFN